MSKRLPWKVRLEPYAQIIAVAEEEIWGLLNALSDDDLAQLVADSEEVDMTNCWWATYKVAAIVRGKAGVIQRNRLREAQSE